jgi:hypothetical protein
MFGRAVLPEVSAPASALGVHLPEFILQISRGVTPSQAEPILESLFHHACESAEVKMEGWHWEWEGTTPSGRKDGNLSTLTVDILDPAGRAVGTLTLRCRTMTASPPPELVLMGEIVGKAIGRRVMLVDTSVARAVATS